MLKIRLTRLGAKKAPFYRIVVADSRAPREELIERHTVMIELISLIAKSLVKQPDAVSVTMVQKGNMEVYELHVAPEDMGKVIGKQGRIAKAIRAVVKAAAIKENKKISVDIV